VSANILVVEDEPDIAALVVYHLARESYRVRTVGDGMEAIAAVSAEPPHLIILDWMLPGISGMEVLRQIRQRPDLSDLPVILLTARKEEEDRLEGFRVGADDYVSKPFSPQELVLRVGAVLRRSPESGGAAGRGGRMLRVGSVTLAVEGAWVEVDDRRLELTPTEFKLLQTLMERRGRVQSRQSLLESVWEVSARITTRTVDMHVQRLRAKLGEKADWIETVRGFGYRFRAP
jgi:two-component system phosphate regulon response regulator PhoB